MAQEALIAAVVWIIFTAIAVLSVEITVKAARRDVQRERSARAAAARASAEAARDEAEARLGQIVP